VTPGRATSPTTLAASRYRRGVPLPRSKRKLTRATLVTCPVTDLWKRWARDRLPINSLVSSARAAAPLGCSQKRLECISRVAKNWSFWILRIADRHQPRTRRHFNAFPVPCAIARLAPGAAAILRIGYRHCPLLSTLTKQIKSLLLITMNSLEITDRTEPVDHRCGS
jgi:hypothetical protein